MHGEQEAAAAGQRAHLVVVGFLAAVERGEVPALAPLAGIAKSPTLSLPAATIRPSSLQAVPPEPARSAGTAPTSDGWPPSTATVQSLPRSTYATLRPSGDQDG